MNKILKTNNNSYLYNAEHKELMFLPKNLFNVIESNLTEGKNQIHNNEVFYYKKSQFLEKKWIESAPPQT
jgi:beta-galactosidase beta subunit